MNDLVDRLYSKFHGDTMWSVGVDAQKRCIQLYARYDIAGPCEYEERFVKELKYEIYEHVDKPGNVVVFQRTHPTEGHVYWLLEGVLQKSQIETRSTMPVEEIERINARAKNPQEGSGSSILILCAIGLCILFACLLVANMHL